VRFIEVIEEGFAGGNVVPADFRGTPRDLETVRRNVVKSGGVGRLVSNDFRGALVRAELLEIDPSTGAKLDYQAVSRQLEAIRSKYQSDGIRLHVIGFAKAVGDITDGARGVIAFFAVAFLITSVLLYWCPGSWKLTVLVLFAPCRCLLMGLLPVLGYGIDPLSILVPFLIFSIGVSHAVQMANAWKHAALAGADGVAASRDSFRKLLVPGATALATDALGFLVIMYIKIEMVQELGVTASLGIALMIITDMLVLPLLLSFAPTRRARESGRCEALVDRYGGGSTARGAPHGSGGACLVRGPRFGCGRRKTQTGDLQTCRSCARTLATTGTARPLPIISASALTCSR
jgi:predicted RND superfamily exporter protein